MNRFLTRIDNIGLDRAAQIGLKLKVDGEVIKTETKGFEIDDIYFWTVEWSSPKDSAKVEVVVDIKDATPDNNTLVWTYASSALSVEPLLPPDQQRRRSASNGPDLAAIFLTTPPTINGNLDDWQGLPCADVNTREQVSFSDAAQWSGSQDLSGQVCYAWDKENIYVAYTIHDDTLVQRFSGANIWKGDHVELWFDTQFQLDFDSEEAGDDDY